MHFANENAKVNEQDSMNAWVAGYGNAYQVTSVEEEMAIALAALIKQVTEVQRKHFEALLTKITDMMKWFVVSMEKLTAVEATKLAPAKCKHCGRNKHHGGNKACLDLEANKDKHQLGYKTKAEHEAEKKKGD